MTKSVKIVNNLTGIEWQNGLLADIAKREKWVGVVTRIILFLLFLLIIIIVGIGFVWNGIKPLFLNGFGNFYNFLVFFAAIIKTPVSSAWSTRNEIKEKEEFMNEKREIFSDISANSIECIPYILKEIQSNIFRFRKNHKPIPDFFYKFYKYREEARSRQRLE